MIVFYRIEPSEVDWEALRSIDGSAGQILREMMSASPGFYTTETEPSEEDKAVLDAMGFQLHILDSSAVREVVQV